MDVQVLNPRVIKGYFAGVSNSVGYDPFRLVFIRVVYIVIVAIVPEYTNTFTKEVADIFRCLISMLSFEKFFQKYELNLCSPRRMIVTKQLSTLFIAAHGEKMKRTYRYISRCQCLGLTIRLRLESHS